MADKAAQEKEVESTVEKVEKSKTEEVADPVEEKEEKPKNGAKAENGDAEKEEDDKEAEEKKCDETDKVCSVKRKSTTGDATSETAAEGSTPEKKAKLGETTEAESNGEAEIAA